MAKLEEGCTIIEKFLDENNDRPVTVGECIEMLMNEYGYSRYEAEESHRMWAKKHIRPFTGEYESFPDEAFH